MDGSCLNFFIFIMWNLTLAHWENFNLVGAHLSINIFLTLFFGIMLLIYPMAQSEGVRLNSFRLPMFLDHSTIQVMIKVSGYVQVTINKTCKCRNDNILRNFMNFIILHPIETGPFVCRPDSLSFFQIIRIAVLMLPG